MTARAFLEGYAPLPGVADEMLDAQGLPRPAWGPFLDHLAALSPVERAAGVARAEQSLRDAGVFYRLYADTGTVERDWPLSPVPVLIDATEWEAVAAGLIQRAELLEAVVADLYGPGRLVAEGHLPAALIAANPEWLRPLVGIRPASGQFLHLLAFEIGRSPDGSWLVLGDRTQAPSGVGFALETRMATARAFGRFYPASPVQRLEGFLAGLRAALEGLRGSADGGVALLTPGAMNDTYFEHAYIARHLGVPLLEGEDMEVREGRLMVRTVAGPRPVDVLWRRLDASFADPLELEADSRLGTPGLVGAVRAGRLAMVNALGSGVLEARALMAFMPRLARVVLGEDLRLPNIATWWCGSPAERAEVAARGSAALLVGPAQATCLPFDRAARGDPPAGHSLADWLVADGAALAAQERVTISTAPAWEGDRLVPRPMSLRAFVLRTGRGWQVMPGGFARIGRAGDPTAIALQAGGAVADVWIVGDDAAAPLPTDQRLASPPLVVGRRAGSGALPARAADNLFWLGRYVERAEQDVRHLRGWHLRLAETGTGLERGVPAWAEMPPLLAVLAGQMAARGCPVDQPVAQALARPLASARGCAAKLRDRFSTDGWVALEGAVRAAGRLDAPPGEATAQALAGVLARLAGFTGLVHDNMMRGTGWRFLTLGRALERADALAATLAAFADPAAPEGSLELAVELADSVLVFRRRNGPAIDRDAVVGLVAHARDNPRSVMFQLATLNARIDALPRTQPGASDGALSGPSARLALRLHTRIATAEPGTLDTVALRALRSDLARLSDMIAREWLA
ncbi:MAG: circularly permuted type 2 ATP-grasp protein [Alkalilacustris sp.]